METPDANQDNHEPSPIKGKVQRLFRKEVHPSGWKCEAPGNRMMI